MVAEDVVVVVTITKANIHTRLHAEDAGDVEHVVVQIKVCDLTTKEIHPNELIGWNISSMKKGFMPSLR